MYRSFFLKKVSGYRPATLFKKTEAVAGRCSVKKVFLKISQKFTGKHLCQRIWSTADLVTFTEKRPATLLKKRLWHRCFPVNFAKFLRNLFYTTPQVAASVIFSLFTIILLIIQTGIYLFKVNNGSTRTKYKICSHLSTKTPERHH